MMKRVVLLAVAALAAPLFADDAPPAPQAELVAIESDEVLQLGWTRQPVMVSEDGELIDDSKTIISAAETAAVDAASEEVTSIAEAATAAAGAVGGQLTEAAGDMAQYCKSFALAFAPETDRDNLTGYVVKETTAGGVDTQWVWYNRQLPLAPVRWVEYQGDYITNAVKVAWTSWSAAGETVTIGGRTWTGCHKCTIIRPAWARDVPCVTLPNEIFGSENGFELGDANLTLDSEVPYTGEVRREDIGIVEYWNNGILFERKPIE